LGKKIPKLSFNCPSNERQGLFYAITECLDLIVNLEKNSNFQRSPPIPPGGLLDRETLLDDLFDTVMIHM
jgi:hypothetical protein